jgi:iron(III) transport system permease protein
MGVMEKYYCKSFLNTLHIVKLDALETMQLFNRRVLAFFQVQIRSWTLLGFSIAFLVSLPLLALIGGAFMDTHTVWQHLLKTVLGGYIGNSLGLMVGVAIGVSTIGTATAWLVTLCSFPGSRFFQWALLLPLAAPAYILAYSYTDLLDYYGPVQTALRQGFGWQNAEDYWFPTVRSPLGAIVMLVLVLYPYVYLLARSAFLNQASNTLEASRILGCNPWQAFWQVGLPLARPAIVSGISLALMETLNDYGTVDYFAVPTFTVGIFRTWFGQKERVAATQLALLLLVFVASLLVLEQWSRQRQRYYQKTKGAVVTPYPLAGWRGLLAGLVCSLPILGGFAIPVGFLVSLVAGGTPAGDADFVTNRVDRFWDYAYHSFSLAAVAAMLAIGVAILLAYGRRLEPSFVNRLATRAATLGYGIPGAVIAVGLMLPLGNFDNWLDGRLRSTLGISTGLLLSGSIAALIFAYLVRFLAVAFGSVSASLENIQPNLDNASRSLGYSPRETLWHIHLPLMRSGLVSGAILVFVDVMKELPATYIMRPPNFDTLAVQVYQLGSDERLAEAAVPALAIVAVGLLPVVLLSWQMGRGFTSNRPDP